MLPDSSIPIVYEGQTFPNRRALARHLAPLLGLTVTTVETALSRYKGDPERIVFRTRAPKSRPLVFRGKVFADRKALATHLAPRLQRSVGAVEMMLIRRHDDVEAVLAICRRRAPQSGRPIAFEGQVFPTRTALATYLAPRMRHRSVRGIAAALKHRNDDVEAVLAADAARAATRKRTALIGPMAREGRTPTAISKALGIPLGTVTATLFHMRRAGKAA